MLDIKLIRDDPGGIKRRLENKGADCAGLIDRLLAADNRRRELIYLTENAKSEQNKVSKQIPELKKRSGGDISKILARMNSLKEKIKQYDAELKAVEADYAELMLGLPNLPDADLPPGEKENNEPLRFSGEERAFDFNPRHHIELCESLGLIDYERGTKLSGSGYWIYRGQGAKLEWSMLNYFIDAHLADGYELVFVPLMLEYACGVTAGQFPKFTDEVFKIENPADDRMRFMLPTAETALVNLFRDEIVPESEMPKKFVSFTPCFRREAGSYRADERGMIRGHQFNKVEMVQYTRPEDSDAAFEELVSKAEKLVDGLGLCRRTVKLAAGDCSASMARTYDIEVYIPSMNGYKEISSVSNARDYQARRGNMRFRREETGKPELMHTLNGSGLATSRLLPALVEQNQREDGSVTVPEALRKYMGGVEVIYPPAAR
ncbi:MAG: serine--tRNA ligase [Oscillospiraceae bacterium]|nr:serine--tRNA ligase [Oscillospiraceae bacterium]